MCKKKQLIHYERLKWDYRSVVKIHKIRYSSTLATMLAARSSSGTDAQTQALSLEYTTDDTQAQKVNEVLLAINKNKSQACTTWLCMGLICYNIRIYPRLQRCEDLRYVLSLCFGIVLNNIFRYTAAASELTSTIYTREVKHPGQTPSRISKNSSKVKIADR